MHQLSAKPIRCLWTCLNLVKLVKIFGKVSTILCKTIPGISLLNNLALILSMKLHLVGGPFNKFNTTRKVFLKCKTYLLILKPLLRYFLVNTTLIFNLAWMKKK